MAAYPSPHICLSLRIDLLWGKFRENFPQCKDGVLEVLLSWMHPVSSSCTKAASLNIWLIDLNSFTNRDVIFFQCVSLDRSCLSKAIALLQAALHKREQIGAIPESVFCSDHGTTGSVHVEAPFQHGQFHLGLQATHLLEYLLW